MEKDENDRENRRHLHGRFQWIPIEGKYNTYENAILNWEQDFA